MQSSDRIAISQHTLFDTKRKVQSALTEVSYETIPYHINSGSGGESADFPCLPSSCMFHDIDQSFFSLVILYANSK